MRLILASASPRRAELLTAAGYAFDVRPVDVDETPRPGESPREYVSRLATEKAAAAARLASAPDAVVLAADTTVVAAGEILGKPKDDADAGRMIRLLSGRGHEVLTGICVRTTTGSSSAVEATDVFFDPLSLDEIRWYVSTGEGRDKAGAYAIQGFASRFIPRIIGSYTNVVGLPVATVRRLLSDVRRSAPNGPEISEFG